MSSRLIRNNMILTILVLLLLCIQTILVFAAEDANTEERLTRFLSIAYGKDCFVAVGEVGKIYTSNTGLSWKYVDSKTSNDLTSVIWNGKKFIAIGDKGTILTSEDGINWKKRTCGVKYKLNCITWNGTKYVAVGDNGTIISSKNLVNWTKVKTKTNSNLYNVVWGKDKFIAIGGDYTENNGIILSSSNGQKWDIVAYSKNAYNGIAWNGNNYVAIGVVGSPAIVSNDGIKWSAYDMNVSLYKVIWDGVRFVAVGDMKAVIESTDGITWYGDFGELDTSGHGFSIYCISYCNGLYVTGLSNGNLRISIDLKKWQEISIK